MTGNITQATGYASRDWGELVQTAGPNDNSEAIVLAATAPGTSKADTIYQLTARLRGNYKLSSARWNRSKKK